MSMNVALTPTASMMGGCSSRGSRQPLPHPTAPDDDPGAAVAQLQAEGQPQPWQQQVAGPLANCPHSAAAASHAYGAAVTSATPPASSGDVCGGCSSPSRGSSILSLSDLSSSQADQKGGSSEGEGGMGLHEGESGAGREGGAGLHEGAAALPAPHVGLHEGAAALPAPHVGLPALPQDGMHTFKVGVGVGFSGHYRNPNSRQCHYPLLRSRTPSSPPKQSAPSPPLQPSPPRRHPPPPPTYETTEWPGFRIYYGFQIFGQLCSE